MTFWDLSLLLVTDGENWSHYVQGQLNKSPKVSRQSIIVDQLLYENPPEVIQACQHSAVILLLVTPGLVNFMDSNTGWFSHALKQIPPTSCIVCFILIDQQEVDRLHKVAGKSYASADWKYFDPGYDVLQVHQTIAKVLDIVENSQAARSQAQQKKEAPAAPQTSPDSKAAAPSTRPKQMPQPPTSMKTSGGVQIFPSILHESGEQVAMVFKKEVRGSITIKFEQTDIQLTPVQENNKVFTFLAPKLVPGKHKVEVLEGDTLLAWFTLTVKPVEDVFCSVHYLCQCLQVPDLTHLDLRLKDMFSASLPKAGFGLDKVFSNLSVSDNTEQRKRSEAVYPTLLHFAAAHGLSEFCSAVLECPGSTLAYRMYNCNGLDPAQLAAQGGFHELETYITDFMEMQTVHDQYITMCPGVFQDPDSEDSESVEYEDMKSLSLSLLQRSRSRSAPLISTTEHGSSLPLSAGEPSKPPLPPPRQGQSQRACSVSTPLGAISEVEHKASTLPSTNKLSPAEFMNIASFQLSRGAVGSRSQNELIEVNKMVKSQEINLNEARMLYHSWQERYGKTPTKSFKERQKELREIQISYQKMREDLNKESKSSKNFFTRRHNKPTIKVNISDPVQQRQHKGPKVYTKSASTGNLYSDRGSSASTTSVGSSSSSRDSGCSQGSRDSHMSSSHECDSEKDEVFEPRDILRRSSSARDSTKRDSLGHLYLQEAKEELEKEAAPPPLPPRNHISPPPPS